MKWSIAIAFLLSVSAVESQAGRQAGAVNVNVRGRNNTIAVAGGGAGLASAGRGINGTATLGRAAFVGRGFSNFGNFRGGYNTFGRNFGSYYGGSYGVGAFSSYGLGSYGLGGYNLGFASYATTPSLLGAGYYGGAYNTFGMYGANYIQAPAYNVAVTPPSLLGAVQQTVQVNETEVKPDGSVVYRTYNLAR